MLAFKNIRYSDVFTTCCGVILFLLCVHPRWVSLSIALLGIVVLIGYVRKKILFRWNWTGILLITLYLAYVIGTFFTDFPQIAFKLLEHKLSLIVFPLLLMIQFKETVSFRNAFIGLLSGCVLGMIIGWVNAYSCYRLNHNELCWRGVNISPIIHPSYFSAYISVALLYLWMIYNKNRSIYFLGICFICTSLCLFYVLYTDSFAGLLFILMLTPAVAIYFIYRKWKWIGVTCLIMLCSAITVIAYRTSSLFKNEIDYPLQDLMKYTQKNADDILKDDWYSSSMSRLILWQMSWEQFMDTPLGVGTGNVDYVLQQRMQGRVNPLFIKQNLNPHNQYLHVGVELGVIGLGVFIALLIYLFLYAWRHRKWVFLTLVASLAFNCLFESMLQRQSGIVFYTLMFCLLSIPTLNTNTKK